MLASSLACGSPGLLPRRQLAAAAPARSRRLVAASGSSVADGAASAPPAVVRVTLRKPIGVVFEQKAEGGPVYVAEVVEGGAAAGTGLVQAGDVLVRCSAVVLKAGKEGAYEKEGYGERVYDNWETIMFDCAGQDFKTCMTALRSNNERWGKKDITLELRRP